MALSQKSGTSKIKYIYHLPFFERTELCKKLNENDKWEELAGRYMAYDLSTIQSLRKESNPTDVLLTMWSHHNHTILELFQLLARMGQYQLMVLLKPYIDAEHQALISIGANNFNRILPCLNSNTKDLKIENCNFNENVPALENVSKAVVVGDAGNESQKILNELTYVGAPPSNSNNLLVGSSIPHAHLPKSLQNTPDAKKKDDKAASKPLATLPQAQYIELCNATDGWDKHNILGKGGFGTVYRGMWKNTDVAVKKIEWRGSEAHKSYMTQLEQSLREIKILNSFPHENILPLYAYSLEGEAPCLVYQLMKNGSLKDKLQVQSRGQSLSWIQRHEIAKGIARGLQYLHTIRTNPLIHGDIKSANILLDKNYEPKIGDFGLAREGRKRDNMKVSKVYGTRPYLPEEFLHDRKLSTKVDTYSYGIVLFELATGLSAYDDRRPEKKFLKDFIDSTEDTDLPLLLDKTAGEKYTQVFHNLIVLGKWCTNRMAHNRPEMHHVFLKINDL